MAAQIKSLTLAFSQQEAELYKKILDRNHIGYTETYAIWQKGNSNTFTGGVMLELPYATAEDITYYADLFKQAMNS